MPFSSSRITHVHADDGHKASNQEGKKLNGLIEEVNLRRILSQRRYMNQSIVFGLRWHKNPAWLLCSVHRLPVRFGDKINVNVQTVSTRCFIQPESTQLPGSALCIASSVEVGLLRQFELYKKDLSCEKSEATTNPIPVFQQPGHKLCL